MKSFFQMTRALVARKRKIFALFFALAASVGLSWAGVAVDGRLPGEFSIAKNKKVYFSQGNLQYNKSTKKWSFMTNQYDRVEADKQEVGTNYANQNIVSFFCWGNGNNPTATSESNKQKFTDYGVNPISNGGNAANIWRTLSEAEWVYMLNQYNNTNYRQGNRFAKAKLFGTTYGLIVFPDSYSHPSDVAAVTGINKTDGTSWNANQYSAADWAKMEAAGCVFLPAAGLRWGTMIRYVNTEANYWTSTPVDNTLSKYEVFNQNYFASVSKEDRNGYGMCVRLVLDKAYYKVNYTCPDKTSGTVPSDATSYLKGSSVTVKGAGDLAKTGYIFAGWVNGTTTYIGGQTFNILANTTLTAQWVLDMGPVNNVIALINAIGTVTYPGSGDKITAAREAYDALTVQAQKDAVANYATLTDAEAAYLALQPDVVAGKIDAIGEVAYTAECKAKIDEARAAYDALPPATQAQVGNYAKLQAAEATYAQLLAQAVKAVKDQIDALPATPLTDATKKLSEYNKVKAARAAYDALSDAEKAAVSNYDKLTAAEAAFAAIDAASPLADAQAAVDLINAIPSPVAYDAASKNAIDAARAAVNALGANASLIDDADLQKLTDAEAAYAQLLAQAVNAVKDQIDALPATPLQDADKKLSEYNKVKAARAAYDALLNADDKALVTNLDKLTAAEAAFAAIGGGGGSAPDGALNGAFTINADGDQILFSKGNLQATTTDLGANWTWGFAANQWNTIGNAAANTAISGNGTVSENGTVDLFGWSTTTNYYGINNSTSEYDYEGDFVDWGATMGAGWRTLTCDEWNHLLFNRTMQSSAIRYARSTVNGIHGLIIVPDDWDEAYYTLTDGFGFDNNIISAADWTDKLEAHGAVFLPVAGFRSGTSWQPDDGGHYSTPTPYTSYSGFMENMNFNGSGVGSSGVMGVSDGLSVRLVTAGAASPLADAQAVKDLIDAIPSPVVYTPECKEAIKAAREALDALGDEAKALFNEADTAALPAAETAYAGLLAEKVAPVIAAIDAVPATPLTDATKKLSEYNKVTDARALYDALATDEEKAAVTNYDKLTAAEAAFAAIGGGGGVPTVVVIYKSEFTSTGVTKEGVNLALSNGSMTADDMLAMDGSFEFSTSLGKFTNITIETDVNIMNISESAFTSAGWPTGTNLGTSAAWTGNSESVLIDCMVAGNAITITCTVAPASVIADAIAAKDLINAIPQPVVYTPECSAAIKAAREAVDALGENASLLDDADLQKLTDAEAAYADLLAEKVAPVITAINALPATPLTPENTKLSEYNKVTDARALYDALTDEEKAAVTNYDKLEAAEAAFAAINKGAGTVYDSGSVALTDLKIGDVLKAGVTLIGEASDNIGVRRVAMNGEKKEGTFYILPFEYMNPLLGENAAISHGPNVFSPIAEDGNAGDAWIVTDKNAQATVWLMGISSAALPSIFADAQAAKDLIDAIPQPVELSDECKAKIDAAREAVTALGENASLLDDADIDKLEKAEADFALLIKDATAVVAKIDAIGEVTFSAECKEKIVDAREAYEALADELKPYVTNLTKLTAAEAAYEAARPSAPVTTVPAAVEALQYTGAAQTLITAGAVEHGTILYSLDGVDYSAELPTALLPGAYTVYYKVQATDDYKDVAPATFTATIAYNYPATYGLFGIPEGWSVKVNGTEATVENGAIRNIAKDDKFDVLPAKPEDVKLVEVVPYILDLATATDSVIYLMNGDSITGTANGNISIVIVPDAKVYFKDVNLTNTGSHPAVLCGGNAEMVVVGENTITCTTEGEYGIRTAGAGTTLTISGDKTQLSATIDPNGGTVNQ